MKLFYQQLNYGELVKGQPPPREKIYDPNGSSKYGNRPWKHQHAGTCAGQAAKHMARSYLPETQYRWFKLLLIYAMCHECIARMKEEKDDMFVNRDTRARAQYSRIHFARCVTGNLARYWSFEKVTDHGIQWLSEKITVLNEAINDLHDALMPHITYPEPVKIQSQSCLSRFPQIVTRDVVQQARRNEENVLLPEENVFLPIEVAYQPLYGEEEEKEPTLLTRLQRFVQSVSGNLSEVDTYTAVYAIERTFFDLIYKDNDALHVREVTDLLEYIQCLQALLGLYYRYQSLCSKTKKGNPARYIITMGGLFFITRLAQANQDKVSRYFSVYLPVF